MTRFRFYGGPLDGAHAYLEELPPEVEAAPDGCQQRHRYRRRECLAPRTGQKQHVYIHYSIKPSAECAIRFADDMAEDGS